MKLSSFKMVTAAFLSGLLSLAFSSSAHALSEGENFITPVVHGFVPVFQDKSKHAYIAEFIPDGETLNNWSQMQTAQIFFGSPLSIDTFFQGMEKLFNDACDHVLTDTIVKGMVNGYQSGQAFFGCNREKETNKGSFTLVRAYRGTDSFYVMQRAMRVAPYNPGEIPLETIEFQAWMTHMQSVSVCDTRLSNHPCPAGMN